MLDHGGDGDRPRGLDVGRDLGQLGEGLLRHLLHEDVQDPAAGETDREGVVVGDPVPLEHWLAVGHDLLREVIDRVLHASAGHRPPTRRDRRAWRRPAGAGRLPGAHDGAHADHLASPPPGQQVGQNLTHRRARQTSASTPESSAKAANECPATMRSR